jgi:hypothetical protein
MKRKKGSEADDRRTRKEGKYEPDRRKIQHRRYFNLKRRTHYGTKNTAAIP